MKPIRESAMPEEAPSSCPHCGADNTSWMSDRNHPNAIGHRHIADKWKVVFERV
jgi:hypothetical protein